MAQPKITIKGDPTTKNISKAANGSLSQAAGKGPRERAGQWDDFKTKASPRRRS